MRTMVLVCVALAGVGCAESLEPAGGGADPLSRTDTPVLLLPAEYMAGATVMGEPLWYALDHVGPDLQVHLQATHNFVDAPPNLRLDEVVYNAQVRGYDAFNILDEDVRVLSWVENGAAYSLRLICSQAQDSRCDDGDYVVELAEKLEPQR